MLLTNYYLSFKTTTYSEQHSSIETAVLERANVDINVTTITKKIMYCIQYACTSCME